MTRRITVNDRGDWPERKDSTDPQEKSSRSSRRWPVLLWRVTRLPLIAYLVVLLVMLLLEQFLVYPASRFPQGDWQPADLPFEDVWFTASDGTKLHGWYVPHPNPRAVVLYAHGNGGNLSGRAGYLKKLHGDLGVAVMIFDYRGYGRSEGSPNEVGILDDARSARTWLAQREGIAEKDIVLLGRSLGGGVMVDLAARDGARGLILHSAFTSLPDVAAAHYPWLPVRTLMRNRLESLDKIGQYGGPILLSHGTADEIVPAEHSRRLLEAATTDRKQLIELSGVDHNYDAAHDGRLRDYHQVLDRWLDELPPVGSD